MIKLNTLYGRISSFILTITLVFLILFIILDKYKNLHEKQIIDSSQHQYVEDMGSLFQMKSSQLSNTIYDYTYWDEFVDAIKMHDEPGTAGILISARSFMILITPVYSTKILNWLMSSLTAIQLPKM